MPVDGVLDLKTRNAVRTFQERQGLPLTGRIGPKTEAALKGACPQPEAGAPLPERGDELEFELRRPRTPPRERSYGWAQSEELGQKEEKFFGGSWGTFIKPRIEDRTAFTPKDRRKGVRDIKKVYALVLHQMAFNRGNDPKRYDTVIAHFAILPNGKITQLHPENALLWASNGFNAGSVAVEFAGNFPNTKGKCWDAGQYGCHKLTPEQIEAGRYLVEYLIKKIGLTHILAHRQSYVTRENDPGPDIWYNIGQWAVEKHGLKDGGPGFKIGSGNPIPDAWRTWGIIKKRPEIAMKVSGEIDVRELSDPELAAPLSTDKPQGPFATLTAAAPGRPPFKYVFTPEDVLWTARFITGEAGGRDDPDNRAVIWAMFNRYALFTHKYYPTFHQFIRAYSTPLQPVLKSWGAAKRHMNKPQFVRTGGYYFPPHNDIPKGQLRSFLDLQATPWKRLPRGAQTLATQALKGQAPNPIGLASEFDNTFVYFRDKYNRNPNEVEWRKFTEDFARAKDLVWIGENPRLNQKKNAFFIKNQVAKLSPNTVRLTPPISVMNKVLSFGPEPFHFEFETEDLINGFGAQGESLEREDKNRRPRGYRREATPGGVRKIGYGEGPLSKLAQRLRLRYGLRRGGNVAVFEFKSIPEGFKRLLKREARGVRPGKPLQTGNHLP